MPSLALMRRKPRLEKGALYRVESGRGGYVVGLSLHGASALEILACVAGAIFCRSYLGAP